jgi:hypothetical protein
VSNNEAVENPKPSNESAWERFKHWAQEVFNNTDQVTFFTRMKDADKFFEAISAAATGWMIANSKETSPDRHRLGLKWGLAADTLNTVYQVGISLLSNWDDKNRMVRTYEKLVKDELGLNREVKLNDLLQSKNPIVKDAATYYNKKSILRTMPDFTGLIRWLPTLAGGGKNLTETGVAKENTSSLYKATEFLEYAPGTTLAAGAKTAYFGWYFSERRTGSHYNIMELWNKTEGLSKTNHDVNKNVQAGEYVKWQEIRTLYENFRKEHLHLKLEEFTIDDPLSGHVFEQVARYMNHTYMHKLFMVSTPDKAEDLHGKRFTHAMLVDLVGSRGLAVEDSIGSAVKVEVMARYGKESPSVGMEQCRKVSALLQKVQHPNRVDYATQDEAVEALHAYFKEVDTIAREFLGNEWPPKYFANQIKPGYIKYFFEDKDIPPEKFEYLMQAMAVAPSSSHLVEEHERTTPMNNENLGKFTQKDAERKAANSLPKERAV